MSPGRPDEPNAVVSQSPASKTINKPADAGVMGRRRPIFRFVLVFGICVALFYLLSATAFFRERFFPWYLGVSAKATAAILTGLGQGASASGNRVASDRFSMLVERGCDAVEPTALFLSAVLASPVALRLKAPGLILGTLALALVNLLRLVALFLTGIYWRGAFEIMHVDVWQAIFIFLALLFWVVWALWAQSGKGKQPRVTA
jgi:exosortase/archaeosortase family protein